VGASDDSIFTPSYFAAGYRLLSSKRFSSVRFPEMRLKLNYWQRVILLVAINIFLWAGFVFGHAAGLSWERERISMLADRGTRTIESYLRFTNTSARQVRVVAVKPSCGCISTELPKEFFAPGEKGEIKVIFEVGNKLGREEKYVEISTDEPGTPAYRVNLVINIPAWLEFAADDLVWSVSSSTAREQFIRLRSPLHRQLEITKIRYDPNRWKVEISDGEEPHSSYLISIRPVSTSTSLQEALTFLVRFNELERDFVFYGQIK